MLPRARQNWLCSQQRYVTAGIFVVPSGGCGQIAHASHTEPQSARHLGNRMRTLFNYFVRGLVVIAPLAVTIYVCVAIFRFVDDLLGLPIPGVGFGVTIVLITLVGALASGLLTRGLLSIVERVITRLPFVRLLYSSTKDLLNAFVGERRRFDKPVLVTLVPGSDLRAIGFMTQGSLESLGFSDHVAVYLPQSYNFAGSLIVVPPDRVTALPMDSADVMAFVVSGGVTKL